MKNWIYLKKTYLGYDEIKTVALATIINASEEQLFYIVRTDIVSKYLHGLKNVVVGHPQKKEGDNVIVLDLPDYAPFHVMCKKVAETLNVQYTGNYIPYLGFVRRKNEIDEQLGNKDDIILFCYYMERRETFLTSRLKRVVAALNANRITSICCGSNVEEFLEGAYDFRSLIEIDEIIKNRYKIKAIVTSEPIVKYIGQILGIPVVFLFSYAYTIYHANMDTTVSCSHDFVEKLTCSLLSVCRGTQLAEKIRPITNLQVKKKFEVPYSFNEEILPYYELYSKCINVLFLPPYYEDSFNTRTCLQGKVKGRSYMPQTREEYEYHLNLIQDRKLKFVVLWQDRDGVISRENLNYYSKLGASGFIVANDRNAKIIKDYNPRLLVISSIVQRLCKDLSKKDFSYYDYIVMFYPFTRSLDVLKNLSALHGKVVIMPNSLCHTDCAGVHHWFMKDANFDAENLCPARKDISRSTFIFPEHLDLFDNYVGGYKLQGREWSVDYVVTICESYFNRITLDALLPNGLNEELRALQHKTSLEEYYNLKTVEISDVI